MKTRVTNAVNILAVVLLFSTAFFILLYWTRIYAIGRIGEAIIGRLRPNSGPVAAFVLGLFVTIFLRSFLSSDGLRCLWLCSSA